MTLMTCELPPQVVEKLAEFCAAGKTGTLQIDVKNGHVVSGKLTELLRIDKSAA